MEERRPCSETNGTGPHRADSETSFENFGRSKEIANGSYKPFRRNNNNNNKSTSNSNKSTSTEGKNSENLATTAAAEEGPSRSNGSLDGSLSMPQFHGHYDRELDIRADTKLSIGAKGSMNDHRRGEMGSTAGEAGSVEQSEDISQQCGSELGESHSSLESSVASYFLTSSLSSFDSTNENPSQHDVTRYGGAYDESDSSNDDQRAAMIGPIMERHGGVISSALAERFACIDSIKWLGRHLPECVVAFLIDEIEVEEAGRNPIGESAYDFTQDTEYSLHNNNDEAHETTRIAVGALGGDDSDNEGQVPYHPANLEDSEADFGYGGDENDSDNASMAAPLTFHHSSHHHDDDDDDDDYKDEQRFRMPRRHSSIEGHSGVAQLLVEDEEEEEEEEDTRPRRRASMPIILRQMHGSELRHRLSVCSFSNMSSPCSHENCIDNEYPVTYSPPSTNEEDYYPRSTAATTTEMEDPEHYETTRRLLSDYAADEDTCEEDSQGRMRQDRIDKTRSSMKRLSGNIDLSQFQMTGGINAEASQGETENFYFTDAIPPASRHDCALLFVDISGFTKLSTALEVEPLKKTINAYFQKIVDEVEAFGGDVLKFAGDAVFCEWQATTSNPLEAGDSISLAGSSQGSMEPWHGLGLDECVMTAAACGAKILEQCAEYPVYQGGLSGGPIIAMLNVHCGVGFGEVVGVHVGDKETKMEYLILGAPIQQVADAEDCAGPGELAASPEALMVLRECAQLDSRVDVESEQPQVIANKSECLFKPKGRERTQQDWTISFRDFMTKPRERLAKRCDDWDLAALNRLKQRMSLYVHPVVVNEEFSKKYYRSRHRAEDIHLSEAELRSVFTVFIMPLIDPRLSGDDANDCKLLILLNDIMLIMTRELARVRGHLRQFIIDDKGVVLIANFGLRGSTFPNMIAKKAIPFATTVQTLLKVELGVECRMGATYDEAYCGVVGGVSRHEYAVLGPSVNLAARLMAHSDNKGFLVAESVRQKAGSRQFIALPPVKAKGYKELVPIFAPLQTEESEERNTVRRVVGKTRERKEIFEMSEDIIDHTEHAKLLLVTAEMGVDMAAVGAQTREEIRDMCADRNVANLTLWHTCTEEDSIVPFSIARPIFQRILKYVAADKPNTKGAEYIGCLLRGELSEDEVSPMVVHLVNICSNAGVPSPYIEIIGRLVLTRSRADMSESATQSMVYLATYIVQAFLQCTMGFDLVVLTLDHASNMDEMSWKVIEMLFDHALNLQVIASTRPVEYDELHADEVFLQRLRQAESKKGNFAEIHLATETEAELEQEGMKDMAEMLLQGFHSSDEGDEAMHESERDEETVDADQEPDPDVGNISELVLESLDSLPSLVRTYLNLGAILGTSFELMDVVAVFENSRDVTPEERESHAQSIHQCLEEAVHKGILQGDERTTQPNRYVPPDHPYADYNVTYKFTFDIWRSNILRLTLEEWKRDMHSLIAQTMESAMDIHLANDYRTLIKLFGHWKGSGSAKKAASLALKMGRNLEDIGLTHQSLIVYRESLDMWKAMDINNNPNEATGGLSEQLLGELTSSDVEHLIRLNVALGRCYTNILDQKESVKAYQSALNFIHKTPSTIDLEDRAIIFPVFSGLFVALRFGHNEDINYEQGLVKMFLKETESYGDVVHFSQALAMKAEMLGRHGDFSLALEVVDELRQKYSVREHSHLISDAYGSDRSGQCIAQSALWYTQLGRHDEAERVCEYVLKDLLPFMDRQNVGNSFQMLYSIIWVMKDNGKALEARRIFEEYVVRAFAARLDERGMTSDRPLHQPILMLLDMVGSKCKTSWLEEYIEWALVDKNGLFGTELNFTMGSAGRTADTLTAEICLLLARHPSTDRFHKIVLICKGYEVASDAIQLTCECEDSKGMIVAYSQVKPIYDELEKLHAALPPERQTRRSSY